MNITCVICSEIFLSTVDIYSTTCGHIFHYSCLLQWLSNSKTCPQCRSKVTENKLIHLYVTTPTNTNNDSAVLQQQLDDLQYQLTLSKTDLKDEKVKSKQLLKDKSNLTLEIEKMKVKKIKHKSLINAQKLQLAIMKNEADTSKALKKENDQLKATVEQFSDIQMIVKGNKEEVENIIKNESDIKTLALATTVLKKSLLQSNMKNKELQHQIMSLKNELSLCKNPSEFNKYESLKLKQIKTDYEKELHFVKQKLLQLTEKTTSESIDESIQRIVCESPVNYNRPIKRSRTGENADASTSHSDAAERQATEEIKIEGNTEERKCGIKRKGAILEISIIDKMCAAPSRQEGLANKLPSLRQELKMSVEVNNPTSTCNNNMFYNGMGYSSKIEIYPTPKVIPHRKVVDRNPTKQSKLKFKKLSADAGKTTRTIPDA